MANSPFGNSDGITNGSAEKILEFRNQHYGGFNVAIVGTGNVDHDALVALAESFPGVVSILTIVPQPSLTLRFRK